MNNVRLNQVLVRFGDDDDQTEAVIRRIQEDGECWMSGTIWHGRTAMRISIVNWRTDDQDIDRTLAAIHRALSQTTVEYAPRDSNPDPAD